MASFDIINAAGYGYRQAWRERRYLMRLAAVPLLVSCACLTAVAVFGWEVKFLRQGLVLLPAYFTSGWMLSHYVRLLFLNQTWPFRPAGDPAADRAALTERAHGVAAGTLIFAVSRFLVAGLADMAYRLDPGVARGAQPSPAASFALLGLVIASVWGFRFLWFFIPAALGYNLRRCAIDIRGAATSLYMIALALVCYLPVQVLATFLISLSLSGHEHGPLPLAPELLAVAIRAVSDLVAALILTGAMAYGLRAMIAGSPRR